MAKQVQLTNGQTALFDDGESLESIDSKLKASGLERVKGGAGAKVAYPFVEAVAGVSGMPGELEKYANAIARSLGQRVTEGQMMPDVKQMRSVIERLGIPTERAESLPGMMAQTATRNIASLPVRAATLPNIVSGITEELAAFPFRDTPIEPYARLAGALTGPAAMTTISGRSPTQRLAREEMGTVTQDEINLAKKLFEDARAAGAPITAIEAVQRATGQSRGLFAGGATRLPEVQRMIESSRDGGGIMRSFIAGREASGDKAIRAMFPQTSRAMLGQDVQEAAIQAQKDAAKAVSAQVGPEFDKLRMATIPQADFDAIVKDNAIVKSVYQAVKSKPEWKQASKNVPENSVGFVEIMRQELGDRLAAAQREGQSNKARLLGQAYDDLKVVADDAVGGDYQKALTATREARAQIQEPLQATPLAAMAETPNLQAQLAATFAKDASAMNLTPDKVRQTVTALGRTDPTLSKDFVGQYIKASFERVPVTSQKSLSGGSRFADNVMGNETQAANLIAAYEAAYGKGPAQGLSRLLNALKAQGERLPVGSPTVDKAQMAERATGKIKEAISKPFGAVAGLADMLINGNYQSSFARAITSPEGVDALADLAMKPISNAQAGATAVALQRLIIGPQE